MCTESYATSTPTAHRYHHTQEKRDSNTILYEGIEVYEGPQQLHITSSPMQSPRGDTDEQRDVYDVFARFAVDGSLPNDKVPAVLRNLRQYLSRAAQAELEKDLPADQAIDFQEFLSVLHAVQEQNADDADLIEAFSTLDKDKTGFVEAVEVAQLLVQFGGLSEEDASAMVAPDGPNNTISYAALHDAVGALLA